MFLGDEFRSELHPSDEVHKTSMFYLPVRKDRKGNWKSTSGNHFWLYFTSDLLTEEADEWRQEIWKMIRQRLDCHFTFLTKRREMLTECLPEDWDSGYDDVTIGCTVENQEGADFRLPNLLNTPIKHRCIMDEPIIDRIDIEKHLKSGKIEYVSAGGESGFDVRPLDFEWVKDLYKQCKHTEV